MQFLKYFFIIFFLFNVNKSLSQAEKDSMLKQNVNDVIKELKLMYELDQSIRNFVEYGEFVSNSDLIDPSTIESPPSDIVKENLWNDLIIPIDSLKTEKMLSIINKYGFPSVTRLEAYSDVEINFNPVIILIHTPFSMAKELLPIIDREYANGNLRNKCEYGYILWNIHGRSDFKYMLENGYIMETDKDGKFNLISTCK